MSESEERQLLLEDKLAILETMNRYAYYIDHKMLDEVMDILTEDAVADYDVFGKLKGKEELREFFTNYMAGKTNFKFWFHMMHNGFVEIEGNTAKGFWQLEMASTFGDIGATWLFGTYNTKFVKMNNQWKLKEVNLKVHMLTPYREGWDRIGLAIPGYPRT